MMVEMQTQDEAISNKLMGSHMGCVLTAAERKTLDFPEEAAIESLRCER